MAVMKIIKDASYIHGKTSFKPTAGMDPNAFASVLPIKAKEYKEVNLGGWYVDLEVRLEDKDNIGQDFIILIPTKSKGIQPFRMIGKEVHKRKVTTRAHHVMFDSELFLVESYEAKGVGINTALTNINNNLDRTSPFTYTVTLSGTVEHDFSGMTLGESLSYFIEEKDAFIEADWYNIRVANGLGQDRGVTISQGKNLQNIKGIEDWSNVVTKLYPIARGGLELSPKYLETDVVYRRPYTRKVEFNIDTRAIQEQYPDLNEDQLKPYYRIALKAEATKYLENNKYPKVSYELTSDVIENMDLWDHILVKHPSVTVNLPLTGTISPDVEARIGIPTRVLTYTYDVISQKVEKVTYGDFSVNLNKVFKDKIDKVEDEIKKNADDFEDRLNEQDKIINEWNKKGHMVLTENEIYFLDKLPMEDAKDVLMIGLGGIAFSKTGVNGTFTSAWDLKGNFNTNFIGAGQIKANHLASDVGSSLDLSSNTSINLVIDEKVTEEIGKVSLGGRNYVLESNKGSVAENSLDVSTFETNGLVTTVKYPDTIFDSNWYNNMIIGGDFRWGKSQWLVPEGRISHTTDGAIVTYSGSGNTASMEYPLFTEDLKYYYVIVEAETRFGPDSTSIPMKVVLGTTTVSLPLSSSSSVRLKRYEGLVRSSGGGEKATLQFQRTLPDDDSGGWLVKSVSVIDIADLAKDNNMINPAALKARFNDYFPNISEMEAEEKPVSRVYVTNPDGASDISLKHEFNGPKVVKGSFLGNITINGFPAGEYEDTVETLTMSNGGAAEYNFYHHNLRYSNPENERSYTLSRILDPTKDYTITILGDLPSSMIIEAFIGTQNIGRFGVLRSITFKPTSTSTKLHIRSTSRLDDLTEVMLEKGTKFSDWNLAPEDVENGIGFLEGENNRIETTMNARMQIESSRITSEITERQRVYDILDGEVLEVMERTSTTEQTVSGIQDSFTLYKEEMDVEVTDIRSDFTRDLNGFRSDYNEKITTIEGDIEEVNSVLDWNGPTSTLTLGRRASDSSQDGTMTLKPTELAIHAGGSTSKFTSSGIYNSFWENDEHVAKSFNQAGITGTLWVDRGKEF